jgi:hypothetical protein
MKNNTYILHEKIKELDLSVFNNNFPTKVQIKPNINTKMMFIGTEFERAFTFILSQKYGLLTDELSIIISKKVTQNNFSIECRKKNKIIKNKSFNLEESINKFDYFFKKSKGYNFKNIEEDLDVIHIKELLKKINFEKFKPKELILTKVKFITKYDFFTGGVNGEIDLVIDDKIIDIKTDTTLKLNKNYIVQLLFYYFLLDLAHNTFENTEGTLNKLKIKSLCLYYASFDLLLEFDIDKIFSNGKNILIEIHNLIHEEFLNYNFNLREIIRFVVFKNAINENYFEDVKNKSIENLLKSYLSHIDSSFTNNIEINNNIDFKSDFLLHFIKINLSLIELKRIDSISKVNYDLILKHLIFSFRKSYKRAPIKNLLKLKDKHMFMSLRDYAEINNAKKVLLYYIERFEKNKITKSLYEGNSSHYYRIWNNLEDENNEEFECFIKNINLLYMEFYDMKKHKIITNKEFELTRDFILKLIEYDVKHNKKSNNELNITILKIIKMLKKNVAESLLTKKQLDETIHKLLSK